MSVFSAYALLAREDIQIAQRLPSLIPAKSYGAINAVWELLLGAPPPDAQNILFRPHDHCYYGVPLPRASIYSFDKSTEAATWRVVPGASATWYHFNRGGTDTTNGKGTPDILAYVTPGIDSDSTNLASNPCALKARLKIQADSGNTEVRFYNRTTGSGSTAATTTTSGSIVEMTISDIPCEGGRWNEIDLEVKNSTPAGVTIVNFNLYENRAVSQPASSGTATLTAASKP